MNTTPTTPTTEDRMDAMALLLQALVTVLECEPRFTAEKLQAWLALCTERMRATGSVAPATLAALQRLRSEVLE